MAESASSWPALRTFMQEHCGVFLADDQHYLMEARLAAVAKSLSYPSVNDYVLDACKPGAVHTVTSPLIDAMTTHETSFFRDSAFWKVLAEQIAPKLSAQSEPLRVWSAACSTGQEPYTLAMLLEEKFPSLFSRLSIIATDVAEGVLATGLRGSYSVFEVNRGITAPRLMRHFEKDGVCFRVKAALRSKISWQVQNLVTQGPPNGPFDLILMRNVLIYFQDGPRQATLTRIRDGLRPSGYLGLGGTEIVSSWPGATLGAGWYAARQS